MELAKSLGAGDEYIENSLQDPIDQSNWLKVDNPYGFDVVVEATGNVNILEDSINCVRRGGKLVVYGAYSYEDRVSWYPRKISKLFPITISFVDKYLPQASWRRNSDHRQLLRGLQVPRSH